jgi:hypothetical protein
MVWILLRLRLDPAVAVDDLLEYPSADVVGMLQQNTVNIIKDRHQLMNRCMHIHAEKRA